MKNNNKVALYLRNASKEELQKQEERLKKYCDFKGYQVYKKYVDFGCSGSGSDMKRTGLREMKRDMHNGNFNKIIVCDIARIGRRTVDIMSFLNEIQFNNCELESLNEKFNSSTSIGKTIVSIFTIFNKFEKE